MLHLIAWWLGTFVNVTAAKVMNQNSIWVSGKGTVDVEWKITDNIR